MYIFLYVNMLFRLPYLTLNGNKIQMSHKSVINTALTASKIIAWGPTVCRHIHTYINTHTLDFRTYCVNEKSYNRQLNELKVRQASTGEHIYIPTLMH